MLEIGIVFLLLTALFGILNLYSILKRNRTRQPIVLLHGILALLSLFVLVGYIAADHFDYRLITSLILFVLAAIGGLTMFTFDVQKKSIPRAILAGHPILALIAFGFLIAYFFNH